MPSSEEVERVTASMTSSEKELVKKLGNYFEKARDDFDNNMSNTIRMCVRFTANTIMKGIEEERYGRRGRG